MTFNGFCRQYTVTQQERRALVIYLGSLRAGATIAALLNSSSLEGRDG